MRFQALFIIIIASIFLNACGENKSPSFSSQPPAADAQEVAAPENSTAAPTDDDEAADLEPTTFKFYDFADLAPKVDFDRVEINRLHFLSLGNVNYYVISSTAFLVDEIVSCDFHYEKTANAAAENILDFEEQFAAINSDPKKREGSSNVEVRTQTDYCNAIADRVTSRIEAAGAVKNRTDETELIQARWNTSEL